MYVMLAPEKMCIPVPGNDLGIWLGSAKSCLLLLALYRLYIDLFNDKSLHSFFFFFFNAANGKHLNLTERFYFMHMNQFTILMSVGVLHCGTLNRSFRMSGLKGTATHAKMEQA